MGKRELIALLNLSSWCLVMVERLFLAVPRGCLQFVIVVFPDHTHFLFLNKTNKTNLNKTVLNTTEKVTNVNETVLSKNKVKNVRSIVANYTARFPNSPVSYPYINDTVTNMGEAVTGSIENVSRETEMTTTTSTANAIMSSEHTTITEDYFTPDTSVTVEVYSTDTYTVDYSTVTMPDLNSTTNDSDITASPQIGDGDTFGDYQGIEAVAAVSIIGICAAIIVVAVIAAKLERPRINIQLGNEFSNPISDRQQARGPNSIEVLRLMPQRNFESMYSPKWDGVSQHI